MDERGNNERQLLQMGRLGVWGGAAEIMAAQQIYGKPIIIYNLKEYLRTGILEPKDEICMPVEDPGDDSVWRLWYNGANHYNIIVQWPHDDHGGALGFADDSGSGDSAEAGPPGDSSESTPSPSSSCTELDNTSDEDTSGSDDASPPKCDSDSAAIPGEASSEAAEDPGASSHDGSFAVKSQPRSMIRCRTWRSGLSAVFSCC